MAWVGSLYDYLVVFFRVQVERCGLLKMSVWD